MHVEFDTPDHAAVVERLLDGFISAGELLIRAGVVGKPTLDIVLQDDDVPSWQLPQQTRDRGIGDCEDIVIWWAAYLRATGKHPNARARIKNTGPRQVHCLLDLGGKLVDVYAEHVEQQQKQGFRLGGWFGSLKHAVGSVGHGISSAAHGVAHAAQAVGRGAESAYHGAADAVHYVAHDLPGAILKEGASGLADVVHGIGDAGSTVVNAVGDVVAGGAGDALHQLGKLGGKIADSFSSDSGPDQGQDDQGAPDQGAPPAAAAGYDDTGGGYDDGADDGGGDPWADAGVDTSTGWEGDDDYDDDGAGADEGEG